MNDMGMLAALGEHLDQEAPASLSRQRQRLVTASGRRRRRAVRIFRLRPALTAMAAAVVVVVAVASVAAVMARTGAGRPNPLPTARGTDRPLSTRQMLLVAAANAERQPAADGAYWHVRMLRQVQTSKEIYESWYGKDGYYWYGLLLLNGPNGTSRPATVERSKKRSSRPFELSDHMFTLAQIRGLPTTPKGIEKWADGVARSISPEWREKDIHDYTTDLLVEMLAEAPARPKARAAAFRALAGRSDVKSGGRAKDGLGRAGYVLVIGGIHYLVDPSTAVLLSESVTGPRYSATTYLEAGWTNESPRPPARP
jgi:hypothetical protein